MATPSIPMEYEILKTVILYTDPNLRFKIARRIPENRLTENAVPLRINSLSLQEFKTTVDSTSYKLGVYRRHNTEETPISIKKQNREGGVSYDLDQYGFENSSTPILNGDVSSRTENADIFRRDTEMRERRLQSYFNTYEATLAKINQLELEGKTVEEFLAGPMTRNDRRIRHYMRYSKERMQEILDASRTNLLPFHYRRNNLSPPYTCYIQLTITQGNATTIQRYEYNHKLYEAAKKLNEILFGNRPVIIANQLENMYKCDVWRLPVGFKVSANSVYTPFGGDKFTDPVPNAIYGDIREIASISSILDPSRTLRNVSVPHVYSNYQHSFVKNAQQLSICTYTVVINQLAWVFGTMENQRFHFDLMDFHTPSANDYFQLVLAWLGAERRVGSMITLGLRSDQIGEEILELVRNRTERAESTERCVIAPLINGRKLQVSYTPLPEKIHLSTFLLTAKIMEGENSQKID